MVYNFIFDTRRGTGEEVVIDGPVIGEGVEGHGGDGGNVGDQIHVVGEGDIVGETVPSDGDDSLADVEDLLGDFDDDLY